jgi:hypothetical protein
MPTENPHQVIGDASFHLLSTAQTVGGSITGPVAASCGTIARTAIAGSEKIAKMRGHGILVVRDQNAALIRCQTQHLKVVNAIQAHFTGALKINRGFAANHTRADSAAEIVVGLESALQLVRAPGTEAISCRVQPLSQLLGNGAAARRCSSNRCFWRSRYASNRCLVLQVIGDGPANLSEVQRFEFAQDGFRRETIIKTLNQGVERHTSAGEVKAFVALFDIVLCHGLKNLFRL